MQLGQALEAYLVHLHQTQTLSLHTLRAYRYDLRSLESQMGTESNVADLTEDMILRDFQLRRDSGCSIASLRRRASAYRGLCRWLVNRGSLDTDPWTSLSLKFKSPRRLPRPLGQTELRTLLCSLTKSAGVNHRSVNLDRLPCAHEGVTLVATAIMVATGLRVGEVVSIRVSDVDLEQGVIRVLGKGQRERQVYLTNEWIIALVDALLSTREVLAIRHDCLLFNHRGTPMSTSTLRLRLARAAESAGVPERVTPHMLRHSAATELIESGVDIRFVQRLLGHASLTTTELYTHVADSSLRRVVNEADVLGRALARISP